VNEIYHFLLPDENMLAVRTIKDYKDQARKENSDTENRDKPTFRSLQGMKSRIADWTASISDVEFRKLQKLSSKIDMLLKEYFQFQQKCGKSHSKQSEPVGSIRISSHRI
jgi:hypothetical protein